MWLRRTLTGQNTHLRGLPADRGPLKPEHLLADSVEGLHFPAQDFPGFFVADLSLAKPLDHIPYLAAVLVGPLMKSGRRTRKDSIMLHFDDIRIVFLVSIEDKVNTII